MRILAIDYGDSKCGFAITDSLNITAQGLKTVFHKGSDKVLLKQIDEFISNYPDIHTIVVGKPMNMDGTMGERVKITENFMHKLKCKYNKMKIDWIDERLSTVSSQKTLNFLNVNASKKKQVEDTLSAVYILETYMNKIKNESK